MTQALFPAEGPEYYDAAYRHNAPFATQGPYQTQLSAQDEKAFRSWVSTNRVPFDPDANVVDYDMRGYWKDNGGKWSGGHFPDTYKTPYDTTFSGESKYAKPGTPFVWRGDSLIDTRDGSLIFGPPPNRYAGQSGNSTQAKHYFVRHRDGTMTPIDLRETSPGNWESPQAVVMMPGDEIVQVTKCSGGPNCPGGH